MLPTLKLLSKHRAAVGVAAVASTAFALFGYDTTIAGGVIALKSFQVEFKLSTNAVKSADISSNVVALLNSGAFFGALAPALLSRYIGRKVLMTIAACFMLLGGTLQTSAQPPSISMIYGGRVISGFGVGIVSSLIPMYIAETAPKQLRGLLMSFTELSLVLGSMVAYWTVYGCSLHLKPTSKQWRVPLSLQVVLGAIILSGSFIIVESPRWLGKQDQWDEAAKALQWLRGASSSEEVRVELAEIRAQIEEEIKATSGRSIKELFQRQNLFRLFWACGIMVLAVGTGQTAILYYAPTVFKQIGFTGQNPGLLASGVFTVVKVVATILFLTLVVQNFKRKHLFLFGSALMAIMLFTLGALLKTHPPITGHAANNSSSGRTMMATIYIYIIGFTVSWGPLSWVYVGEIFPTRIRDYGMAIAVMVIWFFNFVISKWTPLIFLNLTWKTWMLFGSFNAIGFIFAIFLPETKGLSLEEMDVLFGLVDESTRRLDIEEHLGVITDTTMIGMEKGT
ncbi:general substrate transporter [Mollisia scopiformis]|uniref:General substrate transporter n=1 Tax=Mollisia scopiformis TaxID=149040 RepID=A0A194WUB5_MOLSC|nr:general substrate transporter [Mollisia scopiformis]KUJ11555.1 general substrate transporter [Mollisia scopiformis]